MGEIKWYKRDPDAALSGMFELTLDERGAYNTVLDLIYSRDNNLPDDDRFISGWMRCDLRVWKRIKKRLIDLEKLYLVDGLIKNDRADVVILTALSRVASAREAGVTSGLSRRAKSRAEGKKNSDLTRTTVATKTERTLEQDRDRVRDNTANAVSSVDPEKKKAARLPENWTPQRDYPEAVSALVSQWPEGREARELDQFRDYWRSRPKGATKLDWDATWHNRIRDQHDRIMREARYATNGRNAPANPRGDRPDPGLTLYLDAVAEIREAGNPQDDWGDSDPIPAKFLR